MADALRVELLRVPAGGDRDDLERVRMGREDVERLRPDRAGRA
jgi:hypothetical protein